jgi:hypothetical protein
MRIPEVAKSSISLAFSLGVIAAFGVAAWRYIVIPYRSIPPRPTFANEDTSPPPAKSPIVEISQPRASQTQGKNPSPKIRFYIKAR